MTVRRDINFAAFPLIMAFLFLGWIATSRAEPLQLYVAKTGQDTWSGRYPDPTADGKDGPFASLDRARDEIRKRKRAAGYQPTAFTVEVRQGYYCLDKKFALNEDLDSGTKEQPITYRNYQNEQVTLSGGKKFSNAEAWKGSIVKFNIGNSVPTGVKITQLFWNGQRQDPARWPNKNKGTDGGNYVQIAETIPTSGNKAFKYSGDRPSGWSPPENAQVSIWPNSNWYHGICDVESIDAQNRVITLKRPVAYTIKRGYRFFIQNVLEELDTAGEWFYSQEDGNLYFWPPRSENSEVLVSVLNNVVLARYVSNVIFQGFVIEGSSGDGIYVIRSQTVSIKDCTIRHVGGYGVNISEGAHNSVTGNNIYDTGMGGIRLLGGDLKTLTPAGHYAENNQVYKYGQVNLAVYSGIELYGVGNRASRNSVHDGSSVGILVHGNDHMVELNDIYDVCVASADTGAIYVRGSWVYRGSIIRYNKIHDINGYGLDEATAQKTGTFIYKTPYMAWGVYLDDFASGYSIYGNIFYRVPLGGVLNGGGRDNTIKNNIFIGSIPSAFIAARSQAALQFQETRSYNQQLVEVNYTNPPFITHYPEMADLISGDRRKPINNRFERNIVVYAADDYCGPISTDSGQPAVSYYLSHFDPETTIFQNNLLWHNNLQIRVNFLKYEDTKASIITFDQWRQIGFDKDSLVSDPLFVHPSKDDYSLRSHSPAFKLGFERIPVEDIGAKRARVLPPKNLPIINP